MKSTLLEARSLRLMRHNAKDGDIMPLCRALWRGGGVKRRGKEDLGSRDASLPGNPGLHGTVIGHRSSSLDAAGDLTRLDDLLEQHTAP